VPINVEAVEITVSSGQALLVGTDGFGDPLGGGTGDVGELFSDVLSVGHVPSLLEFAHTLDFSRETFDDDRTLVAVWPFHPALRPPRHLDASEQAGPPAQSLQAPSPLRDDAASDEVHQEGVDRPPIAGQPET
jgi:hypothetical protein